MKQSSNDTKKLEHLITQTLKEPQNPQYHDEYIHYLRTVKASITDLTDARISAASQSWLSEQQWIDWLADSWKPLENWTESNVGQNSDLIEILDQLNTFFTTARKATRSVYSIIIWQKLLNNAISLKLQFQKFEYSSHRDSLFQELNQLVNDAYEATSHDYKNSSKIFKLIMEYKFRISDMNLLDNSTIEAYIAFLKIPHIDIDKTFSDFSTIINNLRPNEYDKWVRVGNSLYWQSTSQLQEIEEFELRLSKDEPQIWLEYIKKLSKSSLNDILGVITLCRRALNDFPTNNDIWQTLMYSRASASQYYTSKSNTAFNPTIEDMEQQLLKACYKSLGHAFAIICQSQYIHSPRYNFCELAEKIFSCKQIFLSDMLFCEWEFVTTEYLRLLNMYLKRIRSLDRIDEPDDDKDNIELTKRKALEIIRTFDQIYVNDFLKKSKLPENQHNIDFFLIESYAALDKIVEARKIWQTLSRKIEMNSFYHFWLRWAIWELKQNDLARVLNILEQSFEYVNDDIHPLLIFQQQILISPPLNLLIPEVVNSLDISFFHYNRWMAFHTDEGNTSNKRKLGSDMDDGDQRNSDYIEIDARQETQTRKITKLTDKTRDREHSCISIENLPDVICQEELIKFFRGYADIIECNIKHLTEKKVSVAILELSTFDQIASAIVRDKKIFKGNEINVSVTGNSVLFVTNFDSDCGPKNIEDLFSKHGTVVSVRFPDLRIKSTRRFCYVQMLFEHEAKRALQALDGHDTPGGKKMVVKLSDPEKKQLRSGPVEDKREIYIRNIDFKLSAQDVQTFFSAFGSIVSVKLPTKPPINKYNYGYGFIVFETKEDALKALEANGKILGNRLLTVTISEFRNTSSHNAALLQSKAMKSLTISDICSSQGQNTSDASEHSYVCSSEINLDSDRRDLGVKIQAKSLGILNLASSVNITRLKAIFSRYGNIIRINLVPERQGAIVEFSEVTEAGEAQLNLQNYEIDQQRISIGTVKDLYRKIGTAHDHASSSYLMRPRKLTISSSSSGISRNQLRNEDFKKFL